METEVTSTHGDASSAERIVWAASIFLFVLWLSIPTISQALICPVMLLLVFTWRSRVNGNYAAQLVLLFMFSITYYLISYDYGFTNLVYVIHRPLLFLGMYSLGYYLAAQSDCAFGFGHGRNYIVCENIYTRDQTHASKPGFERSVRAISGIRSAIEKAMAIAV